MSPISGPRVPSFNICLLCSNLRLLTLIQDGVSEDSYESILNPLSGSNVLVKNSVSCAVPEVYLKNISKTQNVEE